MWVIVVAAGRASRFGRAKQYETAGRSPGPRLVAGRGPVGGRRRGRGRARPRRPRRRAGRRCGPSPAGETRSASVRAGLAAVPDRRRRSCSCTTRPGRWPRPSCSPGWSRRCARGADAVVPGGRGGRHAPAPRRRGRRPRRAGRGPDPAGLPGRRAPGRPRRPAAEATDDAAAGRAARAARVVLVDGEPSNRKITDPSDLRRRGGHAAAMHLRVGMGFDVHRTGDDPDRPVRARRGPLRRPPGPRRPQRRRRGRPRGGRRAARRGRAGRHRRALPRHRPGLGRRRQRRPARRGDPPGAGGGLGAVERRLHGRRRRAEAGTAPPATCRHACRPRSARRCR